MSDSAQMINLKQITQEQVMLDLNAVVESENLDIARVFVVVMAKFEDSYTIDIVTLDELPQEAYEEVAPYFEEKPEGLCVPVLYSLANEDGEPENSSTYLMLQKGSFSYPLANGETVPIFDGADAGSPAIVALQSSTVPLLRLAVKRILTSGRSLSETLFLVDCNSQKVTVGRQDAFLANPNLLPEAAHAVRELPQKAGYVRALYLAGAEFRVFNVLLPDEGVLTAPDHKGSA